MPTPPFILAENFDGIGTLVRALPVAFLLLAAISLLPAARGHWAGPALAGPAVGLGALLFLSLAAAHSPAMILLLSIAPVIAGIASISLWSSRRNPAG